MRQRWASEERARLAREIHDVLARDLLIEPGLAGQND